MITTRTAKQCGQADFGWLQARYTFSFGHYFDPKLLGYASLRVLNQEVLAPRRPPSSRGPTRKWISLT
ncbi:Pirin-like protein YhaK [Kluyvera cryocrescens]|uniref:Pirin-like protein YhaK n=1 Tax=Kluyvera cryocrescens TaxID=580 RepID=A0A485AH57_KLUCR|nr:Pirin-like protein YhaK [Kluyvera cryocrescens]